MKFTKELVDDLANKLLIGLSDEENKMVLDEFSKIDADIDIINNIEGLDKVSPMSHALDSYALELREDVASESVDVSLLLRNASSKIGDEIEVPKVVE